MLTGPRKVLTPAQMGAVDRATVEAGIPGLILMENAAHRVVEYVAGRYAPVSEQRIVVVCGKGNNGGDGLAIARQLHVKFEPRSLHVVLIADPAELSGDAADNLRMLRAAGVQEYRDFGPEMRVATLVIDAVLGTGLKGPASGAALDAILEINSAFPLAKIVAVDIPSGLSGETGVPPGEYVRAHGTVTFTAPKICHAMPPACDRMGELVIAPIGSPASLYENDPALWLSLVTRESVAPLFAPRPRDANKGTFGHVLVVAGSRGKSGAAAMCALAALRAGAGLVTVACPGSVLASVAEYAPEVMTEALPDTGGFERVMELAATRSLVAMGPGLGTAVETAEMVRRVCETLEKPMVVDADGLNCLAAHPGWTAPGPRVLTPHPGEMSRLTGRAVKQIQSDRIAEARGFAQDHRVTLVLKGERTLTGFADGRLWINPTGTPAMATGGTGDILTGMIAGLMAQFPRDPDRAVAGAIYLHGLAGEVAARHMTEQGVIATDLLRFLPEAIREITGLPHAV
ncbi:MAG TPA: NAD(P)H-hydrate dehydratase [Bryobacteraceae bacterium]|nr:NAD(P)H-hydrate dehydratase [Bryobacteraceae bacterium]